MKKNFHFLQSMTYLFIYIFLMITASTAFSTITAEIEPNQVNLGDSFELTLTMDGVSSHHTPDLLGLQRDFEISGTQHRVSTTIINGQMETVNQWGFVLTPKRAGKLNIPPIHIGNEESNALTIEVSSQGQVTSQSSPKHSPVNISTDKRLQIQTKVSVKEPYINQQILVTVKLIHQDQLLDANYQPPTLKDALLLPLGDGEQYQLVEKNQIFTVEEQHYALFPQKSGTQMITGANFQALVYRGLPQRVQVKGKPTLLNVKSIPKNTQAKQWLPAKSVLLSEEYSSENNNFDVGATLTRTIKIEARALPSELLPTLKAEPNDHFGVYPEKPITKNSIHKQDVAGIKTLRITYLLNQPGEVTLPRYSLTWFNTSTGKEEITQLPEKTLHISGGAIKEKPVSRKETPKSEKTKPSSFSSSKPADKTPWFIALSLGIAWLLTLIVFVYYKKHPRIKKQKNQTLEKLRHACEHNDPSATRTALIAWAQSIWPKHPLLNLDDLKKQVENDDFKQAISNLSEALYSKQLSTIWKGDTLWHCVKTYRKKSQKNYSSRFLPKINP